MTKAQREARKCARKYAHSNKKSAGNKRCRQNGLSVPIGVKTARVLKTCGQMESMNLYRSNCRTNYCKDYSQAQWDAIKGMEGTPYEASKKGPLSYGPMTNRMNTSEVCSLLSETKCKRTGFVLDPDDLTVDGVKVENTFTCDIPREQPSGANAEKYKYGFNGKLRFLGCIWENNTCKPTTKKTSTATDGNPNLIFGIKANAHNAEFLNQHITNLTKNANEDPTDWIYNWTDITPFPATTNIKIL